ncbi:Fatty acid desaturase domain [Trinorchestia longiramus]|nr:Fatty acid desaturase domain [Trinorchestia longiramus]
MAPNSSTDTAPKQVMPCSQGTSLVTTLTSEHNHSKKDGGEMMSDEFDGGMCHDEHDHHELTFSFRQMYHDTLHLDWSKVLWDMVFCIVMFHLFTLYGIYIAVTFQAKWQSWLFVPVLSYAGGLGITMGTHRLWTHKAFKAVLPVRIVLMLMNSLAFQESIYLWCQNHRVHHKWSDTDRDFTNSRRGFFFAHMGWKMYETHPEVIKGRKMIDCSDLLQDPVVKFQNDYYYFIALTVSFVLPTLIPYFCWNEGLFIAFCTSGCLRLAITLHSTWCINSVAHLYGYKPYDKTLHAFENSFLGPFALGEGWHNYHHAFPRDYRASEIDGWGMNFTTKVIEFLNRLGLVYDLVTIDDNHVEKRTSRTGDPKLRIKRTDAS